MGTTVGVVVTVLVNGVAIKTIVFPPQDAVAGQDADAQNATPKQYRVQINVRDSQDKERVVFYGDVLDSLYLAAWVEEESEKGVVSRDVPVSFQLLSGKRWLRLTPVQSTPPTSISRLERLSQEPIPEGTALDAPTVQVSTTVDGIPVSASVSFSVRRFDLELSGDLDLDAGQALEP
ncbi:MAG: hypothetical protein JSU96_01755 [Acidobacteriota bacterium]|nr:MAG: hypothetical protein JSU96_01755 [Acidobacteriota bacterium]